MVYGFLLKASNHFSISPRFFLAHLMFAFVFSIACSKPRVDEPKLGCASLSANNSLSLVSSMKYLETARMTRANDIEPPYLENSLSQFDLMKSHAMGFPIAVEETQLMTDVAS